MCIKNLKKYTHDSMFHILKAINYKKYQAKLYHDEEITDDIY